MDQDLRLLVNARLNAIARAEDADTISAVAQTWKAVVPTPQCPWVDDLMKVVQRQCHEAVARRGARMATAIRDTLRTTKARYEKTLATELKAMVEPHFPEDLYVAPAVNTRGVYGRSNPVKFDEHTYEHELTLVRVAMANGSRTARQQVDLVIDEYCATAKQDRREGGFWASIELKPNFHGVGIDLRKLFRRRTRGE